MGNFVVLPYKTNAIRHTIARWIEFNLFLATQRLQSLWHLNETIEFFGVACLKLFFVLFGGKMAKNLCLSFTTSNYYRLYKTPLLVLQTISL